MINKWMCWTDSEMVLLHSARHMMTRRTLSIIQYIMIV